MLASHSWFCKLIWEGNIHAANTKLYSPKFIRLGDLHSDELVKEYFSIVQPDTYTTRAVDCTCPQGEPNHTAAAPILQSLILQWPMVTFTHAWLVGMIKGKSKRDSLQGVSLNKKLTLWHHKQCGDFVMGFMVMWCFSFSCMTHATSLNKVYSYRTDVIQKWKEH